MGDKKNVIVALDVGERRIGVAASDELGWMAHPVGTIDLKADRTWKRSLEKILSERNAKEILIGLPRRTDGSLGREADRILKFAESLKGDTGLPVVLWDERFTTKQAEYYLEGRGIKREKKKESIDKIAAQIILQSYLDSLQ